MSKRPDWPKPPNLDTAWHGGVDARLSRVEAVVYTGCGLLVGGIVAFFLLIHTPMAERIARVETDIQTLSKQIDAKPTSRR